MCGRGGGGGEVGGEEGEGEKGVGMCWGLGNMREKGRRGEGVWKGGEGESGVEDGGGEKREDV